MRLKAAAVILVNSVRPGAAPIIMVNSVRPGAAPIIMVNSVRPGAAPIIMVNSVRPGAAAIITRSLHGSGSGKPDELIPLPAFPSGENELRCSSLYKIVKY